MIVAPAGREPLGGDFQGFLDDLRRQARQDRGHNADFADAIGRHPQQRRVHAGKRRIARVLGDRERDDFHGRDHLAGDHRLVGRQRRERDRLVDAVESVDGVLVDDEHARNLREQIGAAGKGAVDMHALARDLFGDLGGRHVFGHVARFEAGHDDVLDTGCFERGDLGGADQRAFLQHQPALADRMHGGGAERVLGRDRAEFHDATLATTGSARLLPRAAAR